MSFGPSLEGAQAPGRGWRRDPALLLVIALFLGPGRVAGAGALPGEGAAVVRTAEQLPLEPLFAQARAAVAALSPGSSAGHLCAGSLNFFLTRTSAGPEVGVTAMEISALETVLFNHPLANVVVLLTGGAADAEVFDSYLREGYCVVAAPLSFDWLLRVLVQAEPELAPHASRLASLTSDRRAAPFLLNAGVLALQVLHGGVSLSMDSLLLNPFDSLLPGPLSLDNTAMFLERVLGAEDVAPPDVLEAEDFERSWWPRSHTDRADGRTTVCGDHLCPRSLPAGCPLGKQILNAWLYTLLSENAVPSPDAAPTRLYKEYVKSRPPQGVTGTATSSTGCEAVTLPVWVFVEPHFPDGWRYYGRRGPEGEAEDRPQYHSQLYSARAHRESSDWSLVRSLKLVLPLDYGPPSARNVMPRSVVDLARRLLSLRSVESGNGVHFGSPRAKSGRALRTPADALDLLDNSMAESLGVGQPAKLSREAALPGEVGGFRTFRDVRVVGVGSCPGKILSRVGVVVTAGKGVAFFCRAAVRPEASGGGSAAVRSSSGEDFQAFSACGEALVTDPERFDFSGSPALVNAAISLLAFGPMSGLGRHAGEERRLSDEELETHFGKVDLELFDESCSEATSTAATASAQLEALLDDVEEQITVVAHSASRCELLERLGLSFRAIYKRLPVLVSCECDEEAAGCDQPSSRRHPSIPEMTVLDVPYDFGLSRGKRLLAESAATEFILVLDDDFVRSPLSCLECMLWHMRSRFHSLTLPFDMLGFPILEDERNFGAFRGKLRATSGRLFLEPMVSEATADGCSRVGIHPMAFLARTARLRSFKFRDDLKVGEHEQFFYANQYLGLQAAVCFDSTFPHFRVQMKDSYKKRRERMQELMTKEFTKIGFPSMMYLLHKYDTLSGADHAEFISKDVPPWHISDDTCGPQPEPPAEFAMFFAMVFSSADARGSQFRSLLRGAEAEDQPSSVWLPKLAAISSTRWAFFLPEEATLQAGIAAEEEEYGDLVFMPSDQKGGGTAGGPSAQQLRFAVAFLRRFQFRWLLVSQQDAFVNPGALIASISSLEQAAGTAAQRVTLGGWRPTTGGGEGSRWLAPEFFAMTQDVYHLLASHRVARWLRTDFEGGNGMATALNAWLAPLELQRAELPGVYTGREKAECPADAAVLHPVEVNQLLLLSDASQQGPPCEVVRNAGLDLGQNSIS
ncbi:unnamed protein product [Polarella glacialis]|uniref:Uncharacterized protein n=1 Tax=Polarella glacialis TaxID=89957 RepID=A0A813LBA8_POLGL|nr:unnamed protein product [Polarella glacialis]